MKIQTQMLTHFFIAENDHSAFRRYRCVWRKSTRYHPAPTPSRPLSPSLRRLHWQPPQSQCPPGRLPSYLCAQAKY